MSQSQEDRRTKRISSKGHNPPIGHYTDVEFSEELADQEDWEALERSERADARQQGKYKL
ncbi:YfhD family protein [Paenibacillus barengoltzii]|uniref:YfhD family protein n=1 Tax=Paenibacillus barengoltzii TaxID=343517 RepID=UPI002DBFC44A|nr:YfhD family protein [Paenibacillus barengoltzii]MEC2345926.1 YfhD family protein [Paenibacillus barengoltzii]